MILIDPWDTDSVGAVGVDIPPIGSCSGSGHRRRHDIGQSGYRVCLLAGKQVSVHKTTVQNETVASATLIWTRPD